ncbi:MAG: hypothetical protein DMG38_01075 [Acidobacteria bacterium]|nr:MAG: hypothetical protein DMG38_01075 [Acidobacteriota bacterium]
MRIALRLALLGLFLVPALLAGADNVQEALTGLESSDTSTYQKAAEFLLKHPQEARVPVRALLQDYSKQPLTRFRAAKLLGDLGDRDAAENMKAALSSGHETNAAVRVEMIRSLVKVGRKDLIVDYFNSGLEKSPSVNAAMALALQGSTDEGSKAMLGRLLSSNDDERVTKAAVFAITKIYKPALGGAQHTASSKSSALSKASSDARKLAAPPPPPPNHPPDDKLGSRKVKLDPTPADKAIFAALKAKGEGKDGEIGKQAQALLRELSEAYKQP